MSVARDGGDMTGADAERGGIGRLARSGDYILVTGGRRDWIGRVEYFAEDRSWVLVSDHVWVTRTPSLRALARDGWKAAHRKDVWRDVRRECFVELHLEGRDVELWHHGPAPDSVQVVP